MTPERWKRVEELYHAARIRPSGERVALLAAPQAFFGLALDGWVLAVIVTTLSVTAWITAVQRILFVYNVTRVNEPATASRQSSVATAANAVVSRSDDVPARVAP